jgi:hypothetical protein
VHTRRSNSHYTVIATPQCHLTCVFCTVYNDYQGRSERRMSLCLPGRHRIQIMRALDFTRPLRQFTLGLQPASVPNHSTTHRNIFRPVKEKDTCTLQKPPMCRDHPAEAKSIGGGRGKKSWGIAELSQSPQAGWSD